MTLKNWLNPQIELSTIGWFSFKLQAKIKLFHGQLHQGVKVLLQLRKTFSKVAGAESICNDEMESIR